jgi:hypothetical protein
MHHDEARCSPSLRTNAASIAWCLLRHASAVHAVPSTAAMDPERAAVCRSSRSQGWVACALQCTVSRKPTDLPPPHPPPTPRMHKSEHIRELHVQQRTLGGMHESRRRLCGQPCGPYLPRSQRQAWRRLASHHHCPQSAHRRCSSISAAAPSDCRWRATAAAAAAPAAGLVRSWLQGMAHAVQRARSSEFPYPERQAGRRANDAQSGGMVCVSVTVSVCVSVSVCKCVSEGACV